MLFFVFLLLFTPPFLAPSDGGAIARHKRQWYSTYYYSYTYTSYSYVHVGRWRRRNEIPNEPVIGEKRGEDATINFGYSETDRKTLVDRLTRDYAAKRQSGDDSQFDIGDYQKVAKVMSMEGYHTNYAKYGTDGDPTFQAYKDFVKLYDNSSSSDEDKENAFEKFQDSVLEKPEMHICWAFRNEINGESVLLDKQKFKDEFRQIWFPNAFEKLFIDVQNDQDDSNTNGLQHSSMLAKNQNAGTKDDKKIKVTNVTDVVKGLVEDFTLEYQGKTLTRTMFVGTTPEFELALYTLLFLQYQTDQRAKSSPWSGSQEYNLNLYNGETKDFSKVTVKVAASLDKSGWLLTGAHPVRSSAAVEARDY